MFDLFSCCLFVREPFFIVRLLFCIACSNPIISFLLFLFVFVSIVSIFVCIFFNISFSFCCRRASGHQAGPLRGLDRKWKRPRC